MKAQLAFCTVLAVLLAGTVLLVGQQNALNTILKTDTNGNLLTAPGTAGTAIQTARSLANTLLKLDSSGNLLVALGSGTTGSLTMPALSTTGNGVAITASGSLFFGGTMLLQNTAPVATTFCTGPSIPNNNGTGAFTVNVGTACATSVGVITLPAATTAWHVLCDDVTNPATTVIGQTGGNTTTANITRYVRTTGIAGNWTDSDILRCSAFGY